MKKWIAILVSTLVVFATSCEERLSPEKETVAIKSVLVDMWDAIEKKDIDRYAKYVHPDFTQFGETDSILREGKNAEISSMKKWLQTTSNVHTEMHAPRVTVKGNMAWVAYYWSDAGLNNGKSFSSRGKSTRIFVKENNQWLCIHGHYTLLP
jgi:ketosteroid isomerase-like protein